MPGPSLGVLLVLATFLVLSAAASLHGQNDSHPKRVVGYFAEWSPAQNYHVADIPAGRLTHINYAFARIRDGQCALRDEEAAIGKVYPGDEAADAPFHGHFRQLQLLKQQHPHLRTLISIGGWGGSELFSDAALTEESRATFARSCARFAGRYGFDGVDIDWEFPAARIAEGKGRAEDTRNFTLLLQALRQHLDEQGKLDGKRYLLTIAAPAGPHNYRKIELDRIHQHLDWINIMTYDFAGSWSKLTAFNAPLFEPDPKADQTSPLRLSGDNAVQAYLAAGVPAEKIVLGVPFFGRAWGGVRDENNGLFQPHDGKPPRPDAPTARNWTYRVIAEHYLEKSPRRFWHDQAKVPWLYDPQARLMVSYDDPESIRLKADYVRQHNLGGVMIWELSQDDARASLLEALHDGLGR